MKLLPHHYFELFGIVMVLVATTFQLTFLTIVSDISNDIAFLRVEEKLNLIWFELSDIGTSNVFHDSRDASWDRSSEIGKYANNQKDLFSVIYIIVMLLGSVFLVLGRWLEMKAHHGVAIRKRE